MLSACCVPSPVLGVGATAVHEAGKAPTVCGAYYGTDKPENVGCDIHYKGNKQRHGWGYGCCCEWACNI